MLFLSRAVLNLYPGRALKKHYRARPHLAHSSGASRAYLYLRSLSRFDSRAMRARTLFPFARSIGFCAIWVCCSSCSSMTGPSSGPSPAQAAQLMDEQGLNASAARHPVLDIAQTDKTMRFALCIRILSPARHVLEDKSYQIRSKLMRVMPLCLWGVLTRLD